MPGVRRAGESMDEAQQAHRGSVRVRIDALRLRQVSSDEEVPKAGKSEKNVELVIPEEKIDG